MLHGVVLVSASESIRYFNFIIDIKNVSKKGIGPPLVYTLASVSWPYLRNSRFVGMLVKFLAQQMKMNLII